MILRICIVVPTFNNPNTISDVLKDIVLHTPFPVLVIDDGSETPVSDRLYSWDVRKAMDSGRVRVVRRSKNQGKGAALQFAIGDLVAQGFTHMLTMDGDGQHMAREIGKLAEAAKKSPWDLIIGTRKTVGAQLGRRFSNFWVSYQTGLRVQDAQSGFRIYPLFAVQNCSFFTKRYDFETEVLIRMAWKGVNVQDVESDILDYEQDEQISHFHRVWDNFRLVILNMVLVVVSLLKSHTTPFRMAVSTGLGVFVGCTPFIGFHSLIVVGLSAALRLNLVAMMIASHITIPFFPFILIASVYAGSQWLGVGLGQGLIPHFEQWLAGSLVVGLGCGAVIALFTFVSTWLIWRRVRNTASRARLLRAFLGLNEYYKILQPKLRLPARWTRIAKHLMRFVQIRRDRQQQKFSGLDSVREEIRADQESIVLGAHLGGWDLLPMINENAVMGDRSIGNRFELIPFLGRLAPFDVTVFAMAASSGVPIRSFFAMKGSGNEYVACGMPSRLYQFSKSVPRDLQLYAWMESFVHEVETVVKQYPDQWFNLYPFWSVVPRVSMGHHLLEDLPLAQSGASPTDKPPRAEIEL